VENEVFNAPDRAAAIVMASSVENAIEKLLRDNIRREGVSELFSPFGVLGSFSAKIDIAYAINLFGEKTKMELHIIRHLRNQFAHSRMPIQFNTPVVKKCCDQLNYPDIPGVQVSVRNLKMAVGPILEMEVDITRPRTRYFVSCGEIVQRVYFPHGGNPKDHFL
jgi:hypothetical protein